MKVQNKQNQPNFGMKIIQTKPFERLPNANGWQEEIAKISERLEKKFPSDKRTFELSPNHILAEEKGDTFGMTYEFAPTKGDFESPEQVEKAIIKTVAGQKAMKSLPLYMAKLNEKLGINIDFNPRNLSSVAGNDARSMAKILKGIAKGLSDTRKKEQYIAKVYNNGSTSIMSLKVERNSKYCTQDFLLRRAGGNTEESVTKQTQSTINCLKNGLIQDKKRAHAKAKATLTANA